MYENYYSTRLDETDIKSISDTLNLPENFLQDMIDDHNIKNASSLFKHLDANNNGLINMKDRDEVVDQIVESIFNAITPFLNNLSLGSYT